MTELLTEVSEPRASPRIRVGSIICFDGPSCAGKTTLAQAYAQEVGGMYEHLDQDDAAEDYGKLRRYRKIARPLVLDRGPLSHIVYDLMRGHGFKVSQRDVETSLKTWAHGVRPLSLMSTVITLPRRDAVEEWTKMRDAQGRKTLGRREMTPREELARWRRVAQMLRLRPALGLQHPRWTEAWVHLAKGIHSNHGYPIPNPGRRTV